MPSGLLQHLSAAQPPKQEESKPKSTLFGQVIEYISDKLYLASFTSPPDENTPFPLPVKQEKQRHSQSPNKRSSRQDLQPQPNNVMPIYFTVDYDLLYNAFHADFGPLHIGHLFRFAVTLHELLSSKEAQETPIVLWSDANPRSRANLACLLACYMVMVQNWPPHLALAPISQAEPPLMPFRDAGYSQADYSLTVQDFVYGVWRAKEEGVCSLDKFNLAEYETFERVDMGDFNWIAPHFVAFASPQHQPTHVIPPSSPEFAQLPRNTSAVMKSNLPTPFKNVLAHFRSKRVGLVVRLNSELYSPSYFAALGMTHLDMIFEDGTCPTLQVVRRFIKIAHDMITRKNRSIAVHCKAGLGRTGCLIGAYLIYRHGFTANEVIAYMRFMRPGMVVGPQQHWLHLNQGTFRQWWFEDSFRQQMAEAKISTPPKSRHHVASNGQTFTPPEQQAGLKSRKRSALGELDFNDVAPSPAREDNLPAPTPGQPRKTSKKFGVKSVFADEIENDPVTHARHSAPTAIDAAESDEEAKLRMLAETRRASRSPSGSHKKRAVTTTVVTEREEWIYQDDDACALNGSRDELDHFMDSPSAKRTPPTGGVARGGGGSLAGLNINKRSPVRKVSANGVRKTSGRVGSAGVVSGRLGVKQ